MTREQLIVAIWDNEDAWSCPKYNCDEPEEEGNTGECCKKCAENQLVDYEQQIRSEIVDEELQNFAQWLWDSNYLVAEALTIRLVEQYKDEQLKEQNKC